MSPGKQFSPPSLSKKTTENDEKK